jgi:cytochrome c oxidase subunit 2
VGKGWAVFFGVILAATFLIWLAAPAMGWWLPENIATFGGEVDGLFFIILALTGFFFILTEALMVYCMWKYAYRPGEKADYVEGNNRLEMLWTAVPAAILLFIAFAQIGAWERIKYATRMPPPHQVVQVTARQWEWRIRYPAGPDADRFNARDANEKEAAEIGAKSRRWGEMPAEDDVHLANELHTWKGAKVKIYLKTVDVLHSFGIPNLRLMQDALPGKTIPMWFEAMEANTKKIAGDPAAKTRDAWVIPDPKKAWEIACKELCGNGHYRMRGLLYVHETEADYKDWLKQQFELQRSHTTEEPTPAATP